MPSLPLPIAALVRQAKNSHDATRRHLAAYYAWEASVRLCVAASPPEDPSRLAMPSVGDWVSAVPKRDVRLAQEPILGLAQFLTKVTSDKPFAAKSIQPKQQTDAPFVAQITYARALLDSGTEADERDRERHVRVVLDSACRFPLLWGSGRKTQELEVRIALASGQKAEVPATDATTLLPKRVRSSWMRARMIEASGQLDEAAVAYVELRGLIAPCLRSERWGDMTCAGFIADGLVRHAELEKKRGAAEAGRASLDALDLLWPGPDGELELVRRAKKLRDAISKGP